MSKLISDILNVPRPSLAMKIDELEHLSGRPGLDIRLTNELRNMYKQKASLLGLDGNDTSPKELYFAMKNHIVENNKKLEKVIGINEDDTPVQMVNKTVKFIEKRLGKRSIWAVKPSLARKQLKANPPKKLMKILSIRSMDSALKREGPGVFYCFAKTVEGKGWVMKHASQATKMTAGDFDYIKINISNLSEARRKRLKDAGLILNRIIYSDQESAHIEICVPEKRFTGDTLFIADTLIYHIRLLVHRSEYYKSQGMKPDFTDKLQDIRLRGFQVLEDTGHPYGWSTLIYGSTELGVKDLVNKHEPFVSGEDIFVPSLAQILNFDFWKHPFGMYHDGDVVVSFNLSDMIINTINKIPLESSYVSHGRTSLQNELFARYFYHAPVKEKAAEFNFARI